MIFARKMPEFYIVIGRKIFFRTLGARAPLRLCLQAKLAGSGHQSPRLSGREGWRGIWTCHQTLKL